jgi:antitoxin HicB
MLTYPVRMVPADAGAVQLVFPDVPEAQAAGSSEDDVFARALPALEKALAGYVLDRRSIPAPTDICGAPVVTTERFSLVGLIG